MLVKSTQNATKCKPHAWILGSTLGPYIKQVYMDQVTELWLSCYLLLLSIDSKTTQIAKFMGPTWGSPGSCRPQIGPILIPSTLLSGQVTRQPQFRDLTHMFLSTVLVAFCELFTHILQCYFIGIGAISWVPLHQRSNPQRRGQNHPVTNWNKPSVHSISHRIWW